jgi:hypothetical protein
MVMSLFQRYERTNSKYALQIDILQIFVNVEDAIFALRYIYIYFREDRLKYAR